MNKSAPSGSCVKLYEQTVCSKDGVCGAVAPVSPLFCSLSRGKSLQGALALSQDVGSEEHFSGEAPALSLSWVPGIPRVGFPAESRHMAGCYCHFKQEYVSWSVSFLCGFIPFLQIFLQSPGYSPGGVCCWLRGPTEHHRNIRKLIPCSSAVLLSP